MMDGVTIGTISSTTLIDATLRPVAWALVHFLWQGTLVALAVAGLLRLLRTASAPARYAVACAGLLAMAALPVATLFLVGSAESGPSVERRPALLAGDRALTAVPPPAVEASSPALADVVLADFPRRVEPFLPILVAFWALGVALLSAVHLGGWRRVRRLRRETRPVEERWRRTVARLAGRLGVRRTVRLRESSRIAVPAVVSWLRPAILVPASAFTGLSPQQLEALLAHELAHVKRHDGLVNLFQVAIETLLFYHPGVWWLSRRIRVERENCCDDLAVRVCGNPVAYARALADLEGLRSRAPAPAFALAADGGSLLERVRRLAGRREPSGHAWLEVAVAGLIAALAAAIGSALLLVAAPTVAMPPPQEEEEEASWRQEEIDEMRQEIAGTAYERLSDDEIARLAEEGLDGEDLLEIDRAGYADLSTEDLLLLAREGVDGDDLRELRDTGYGGLSIDEIASLAREGVDGEDVRELHAAGYVDLALDEIMALAREGVDGEDLRELREAGFTDLSIDEVMVLAREGVDGEDVRELHQAGYQHLSVEELVTLAREGVDGEDVRELHDAGYRDLSAEELVMLAREGVDGEDVRELRDAGFRDLAVEELMTLAREGVDGDDVRELREAGLTDLSVDDAVLLAREGVDGDEVRELRDAGFEDLSIDDLVRLARQGVDGDEVRELREAGLEDLSIDDVLRLARWGVDGDDVEELRAAGHDDLTVDKIIDLVRRGEP